MSRGLFLAGLLATLTFPMGLLAAFGWANDRWPIADGSSRFLQGAAVLGLMLVLWSSVFPIWRWLFRRRLLRRGRKLWWAGLPGWIALLSPAIFLSLMLVQWWMDALMVDVLPGLTLTFIGVLLGGPFALGGLTGLAVAMECLRPDSSAPPLEAEFFD